MYTVQYQLIHEHCTVPGSSRTVPGKSCKEPGNSCILSIHVQYLELYTKLFRYRNFFKLSSPFV